MKSVLAFIFLFGCLVLGGCKRNEMPVKRVADSNLPRQDMPLPDNAYKAQLQLAEPLPKMSPGQKLLIKVKVKNASDALWVVYGTEGLKYRVAVGNGWLDKSGKVLTTMDGRRGLPENLKPGEEVEVPLQITAPSQAGDYILLLDMVQEGVTWFSEKGSETLKTNVKVV